MAILKAINARDSGREKFVEMVDYIFNPSRNSEEDFSQTISDFELDTFVNRFLHGQQKRKRQFKQFVVSLEVEWPIDKADENILKGKLRLVLHSAEGYFANLGYLSKGAIHLNTAHPHFHLLLETCNALTGKQFSQAPSDLAAFKSYVSDQLVASGLEEVVRMREITDEEFLSEEEAEEWFDRSSSDDDWYDDDELYGDEPDGDDGLDDDHFADTTDWNNGTLELGSDTELDKSSESKTLSVGIEPTQKREMCRIVKREMCHIVKREMCRIIPDGKKTMCVIVPDKKD